MLTQPKASLFHELASVLVEVPGTIILRVYRAGLGHTPYSIIQTLGSKNRFSILIQRTAVAYSAR